MTLLFLTLLFLMACAPKGASGDSGSPSNPGDGGGLLSTAIVATVSADYTVGVLAAVDLPTWAVSDQLTAISSDPAVVVEDGRVYVLGRYNTDSIRIYEPGNWTSPLVEFSVGDRANPIDVAVCADRLFVSLYDEDFLGVYDPANGNLVHTVDLSAFDDGDGSPEASELVTAVGMDGLLYVALQQLAQDDGWLPDGGTVVEVDCESMTVTRSWDVGPDPTLHPWPGEEGRLLVRTGAWYDAEGEFVYDGDLAVLDVATDTLVHTELTEAEQRVNFTDVVVAGAPGEDTALLLAADEDWNWLVYCVDLGTFEVELADRTASFLGGMQLDDRGDAWIPARPGWADTTAPTGLAVWDVDQCLSRTGDDLVHTALPPVSVAFY